VSVRRFHVRPEAIDGTRLTFAAAEARHIARVLRLRAGDVVQAVDGAGGEYTVRLERVTRHEVTGTVLACATSSVESPLSLTLAQGIPKGDTMESIVRAVTELGVARVVPVLTGRTVVKFDAARARDRTRRWQRVAAEAAKQCGRAVIPPVAAPRPLAQFLSEDTPESSRLCCWEGERRRLGSVLDGVDASTANFTVLIGPEGGLSEAEVDLARAHGFIVAGLGPRILRTETAGAAVVAMLQFIFGDLG
jgi:16S rRNA (uracil1498-N3)-methyltransferase